MTLALTVVATMLCGLWAGTSAVTLGSVAAIFLQTCALGYGVYQNKTSQYVLILQASLMCSFPILGLPNNLRILFALYMLFSSVVGITLALPLLPRAAAAWMLYFLALGFSTAIYSQDPNQALVVYAVFFMTSVPAYMIAGGAIMPQDIKALGVASFTGAISQAAITSFEVFGLNRPIWQLNFDGGRPSADSFTSTLFPWLIRGTGTFGHPLPQSLLYVICFGIALSLGRSVNIYIKVAMCLVCIYGAALGSARSALLAMAILLMVANIKRSIAAGVAVLTTIVLLLVATDDRLDWDSTLGVSRFFETGSYSHRIGTLSALPDILQRSLLELAIGHGVRGQSIILQYLNDKTSAVDNQFLSAIVAGGLVGFIALLIVIVSAWLNCRQLRLVLGGIVLMFFSFDVASWLSTLPMFAIVLGLMNSRILWAQTAQHTDPAIPYTQSVAQ